MICVCISRQKCYRFTSLNHITILEEVLVGNQITNKSILYHAIEFRLVMFWDQTANPHPRVPVGLWVEYTNVRDCVLFSVLTDSQLCCRFLAQLAEL